jgi:OmpA-OmpF porin, OOP family
MKTIIRKILTFFLLGMMTYANAQIINVPKRVQNKAVDRINRQIDKGIDKGLDAVEDSILGNNKKSTPPATQKTDPKATGTGVATAGSQAGEKQDQPSLQAYSKYDFVPGEKVIFFEDFSQDAVGDFPALWNTNGSGEVVETNLFPGRWLKFMPKAYAAIWTDQLLKLPDNYTVEFDIIPTAGNEGKGMAGYSILLYKCKNLREIDGGSIPADAGFWFTTEYYGTPRYRAYINHPESEHIDMSGSGDEEKYKQKLNQKYHISIWVQKTRLRLYINENKVFDLPRAISTTSKFDRFRIADGAGLISNIRIAVGAPDMRNKLMTEGKLVTYGIYFDVNKDVVKPESYGTLKEIAKILNEVPDVKVKIVGHTDSDGADAANLDLSKRRAASVKNELVKNFNVNGDRLVTDGMGESQPVAANDTPANKALNRRVEFIKQ